ncbi:hypothetical protein PTKIN_Ptkin18bG0149400 [Pterospermum kingtungense]
MEGGSNSTSCMMAFGHNSNGVCPMTMMPPMTAHPHHHHHPNSGSNSLFLPLPPTNNQDQNNHNSSSGSSMILDDHNNNSSNNTTGCYFMDGNDGSSSSVKAKIMAHPHYHRLLAAYVNCQKVGAPPDVVARLEAACASAATMGPPSTGCIACGEAVDRNGSSEEEVDVNNNFIDPLAEDRELKGQLLRKYSGYLGSLKQEFMKKRKKGKLPKEARQQLLDWWSRHYKWPYPSESQKLALAESTGLDQKQINNWFINQRKRHWKPSEDMQFVVMDATHPHYFMDSVLGNPFPMDLSHTLL